MTYKRIEASREVRLWIGQVIVPAVMGATMLAANPQVRYFVADKYQKAKSKIKARKQ